jgi:hypothetical protein
MTDKTQKAYIAANQFFDTAILPFGAGVIVEANVKAAQAKSVRQNGPGTKNQWYEVKIPHSANLFHWDISIREQPYPVLHNLMSQKSLSAIFYDDFIQFKGQLNTFLKDKSDEEKEPLTTTETISFFHSRRELLLTLPSGESFFSLCNNNGINLDKSVYASFFEYVNIPGIQFTESGETRFFIFNARKTISITAIYRAKINICKGEDNE